MPDPLDSRQLRAFSVLARTGSFTETARELHLTQSAVSHAIRTLEGDVGCRLLDRAGKKATLTQSGEQLLASTEKILGEMGAVREQLKRLSQWGGSRLRLAAAISTCQYLLPGVLKEFRRSYPACTITIEPVDTPTAIELLREHRVDLAVGLAPRQEPQVECRPLFTDELQFLLGPTHPWARNGRVVEAEITRQQYILYDKTSYTVQLTQEYFRQRGQELSAFMELGSMEAIKELVKLNLGVGIMAPWIARKELAEGSLRALPLGRKKLRRTWGLLHGRARRLSLPEEAFLVLCQAAGRRLSE